MRKKTAAIALILMISIPIIFCGHALADQKSEAFLPEPVFAFDPVREGDTVTHDFIIKNKGKAPLEILKVDTD